MSSKKELTQNIINAKDVEVSPIGININFSNYQRLKFKSLNIKNSTLTGVMNEKHLLNKTNIILSNLKDLEATNVNYTAVDIKDTHIDNSIFNDCRFNDSAIINSVLDSVNFVECSFKMTSITGTHFFNVIFEDCDLSNVVINTCQFINCKFKNCKTSNKIIEMSLLYESYFYKTDIYLESILENFGLTNASLEDSRVKIGNSFLDNNDKLASSINEIINSNEHTAIDKFKLDFFTNPSILTDGSEFLDQTFNYTNWIDLCIIPKTFSLLLEFYSDFLFKNFDDNKVPVWGILKLHTMTGNLLEQEVLHNDVFRSVSGVHLSLSRFVEKFYSALIDTVITQNNNKLILLVNGPLDKDFYSENLESFFDDTNLNILNVVKHNSPNELILSWLSIKDIIPIISVLLATRFKVEFENLKDIRKKVNDVTTTELIPIDINNNHNHKDLQAFSFELGFDENESFLYQMKLKIITPGDLLFRLRLGLNTKILGKVKKILISLLNDTAKK
jgi:uncharacterized protein YjbI with pentapeptide repeats